MDSNNKDNRLKKYDEKSLEKLESRIVFNNNPQIQFVFKKGERVAAALYLITNLLSDNEPLKWKIREKSLVLLSEDLTLLNSAPQIRQQTFSKITTTISELNALCKIAHLSNHISSMNYSILVREFNLILESLENIQQQSENTSIQSTSLFSADFFNTPEPISTQHIQVQTPKGHYRTELSIKDTAQQTPKQPEVKKDSRREVIIKLLKDGKILGIKDFSKEIKDCSEKTIQRELLTLVEQGVLNKKGERRWSVYSLV